MLYGVYSAVACLRLASNEYKTSRAVAVGGGVGLDKYCGHPVQHSPWCGKKNEILF